MSPRVLVQAAVAVMIVVPLALAVWAVDRTVAELRNFTPQRPGW